VVLREGGRLSGRVALAAAGYSLTGVAFSFAQRYDFREIFWDILMAVFMALAVTLTIFAIKAFRHDGFS
jgi:diacylglycerol kinase